MTAPATRRERQIAETAAAEAAEAVADQAVVQVAQTAAQVAAETRAAVLASVGRAHVGPLAAHRSNEHGHRARPALTAAATPVTPGKDGRWHLRAREAWQDDAYAYARAVPELKFAVTFVTNAFGKIRLVPAVQPDPDEPPLPVDAADSPLTPAEQEQVRAELARLRSPRGGQSRIVARLGAQLFLVGECYLVGKPASTPGPLGTQSPLGLPEPLDVQPAPESWEVLSVHELVERGQALVEKGQREGRGRAAARREPRRARAPRGPDVPRRRRLERLRGPRLDGGARDPLPRDPCDGQEPHRAGQHPRAPARALRAAADRPGDGREPRPEPSRARHYGALHRPDQRRGQRERRRPVHHRGPR